MRTPGWQRIASRIVLVTFTTCFVGCGGSQGEPPVTTTSTTTEVTPTTEVPTTLPPAPPPTQPAQPPPTLPAQPPDQLSKQDLRDLVAPVALYPDVVLASLLPATTNPDQVHDAAQYVGNAQRVERIPDDRGWDGSVVGLLQFPDVLRWLDGNPAWTDQMGQAVTYQQGDVLDAIQDYRRSVREVGNLKSNQYQTVHAASNNDIYIEPARPDIVYVPSYDPVVATQPQPVETSPGINPWLAFGGGAVVGALGAWALYSIFNDDDDHHVTNNYYGGGGRRRIQAYDNYYYARGRRPRPVDWTPRQPVRRARVEGWQHPHRFENRAQAQQMNKVGAPLRPPMKATTTQAPRPADVRRQQRQEHREQKQQNQQQQQIQRQEHKQEQREQKQQRQQQQEQQRQEKRQQQQQQRQERQDQRQLPRQERQERQQNRQEQHLQQQENRQQQQQQRQQKQQEQKEQRQEQRQQQQEQRQEHQAEQREQRQEKKQNAQQKKKQAQPQQ